MTDIGQLWPAEANCGDACLDELARDGADLFATPSVW
jgi:hypothetical protein